LDEGSKQGPISAFIVEPGDGGIVLENRLQVMSPHSVGTWRLDDCRIPADRLVGQPGQGIALALAARAVFRPTVGAAPLGLARRALHEALRRSTVRTTFGKPIAEHQLVQAK